jgi:hypothetical protein
MAQTYGRITAAALIAHLPSVHDSRNRQKPVLNGEAVLPGASLLLLESLIDGDRKMNNTRHPLVPSGATALHILHTPSVPSTSTSFCTLQGTTTPGEPQNFSAVGGAHSGCYEAPILPPRSSIGPIGIVSARICRRSIRLLTYPGNDSVSTLAFLFHSYSVAPSHTNIAASRRHVPIQE